MAFLTVRYDQMEGSMREYGMMIREVVTEEKFLISTHSIIQGLFTKEHGEKIKKRGIFLSDSKMAHLEK